MKFCPECASIFKEDNTACDVCGYGKSDEEKISLRIAELNSKK